MKNLTLKSLRRAIDVVQKVKKFQTLAQPGVAALPQLRAAEAYMLSETNEEPKHDPRIVLEAIGYKW